MSLHKNRTHTRFKEWERRWTCFDCGKFCFVSRSAAKQYAQSLPTQEGSTSKARPYRCAQSGEWHIGHLPDAVRRGDRSRDEVEKTMDDRDQRRRERE